jgi:hypothetical protein
VTIIKTQEIWRVSVKNFAVFLRVSVTNRAVRPECGLIVGLSGFAMGRLKNKEDSQEETSVRLMNLLILKKPVHPVYFLIG